MTKTGNIHSTAIDSMRGSIARYEAEHDNQPPYLDSCTPLTPAEITSIMETRRSEFIPYPQRVPWWRQVMRLLLGQRGYMGGGR